MGKLSVEEVKELLKPLTSMGEEFSDVIMPSVWQVPEGYILEKFQVSGVQVEHLIPEEKKSNTVIYHLHGGGYAFRYMDVYRDIAMQYSKTAGGAEVFSIDYGCAPNHVFPAALDEAMSVYKWLLEKGYAADEIVIAGDSAGGNLALVTTMYIRDHGLPMPKGVIGISPWTCIESVFPSRESNAQRDLVLGTGAPFMHKLVLSPPHAEGMDKKNPYVSPVYGDFQGFPPMLLQCGSAELFVDEVMETAKKAKAAGVDVTVHVYPEMFHDFQLLIPMFDETQEAWKEIGEFLAR